MEKIRLNIKEIWKNTTLFIGVVFSIISVLLSFFTWNEVGVEKGIFKLLILIGIMCVTIVIATFYTLHKKKRIVWRHGQGMLVLTYGDIIKRAFVSNCKRTRNNKTKTETIIVIPVNTCFDVIVDGDIVNTDKQLVSPKSIHGKWIEEMEKRGIPPEELYKSIKESLRNRKVDLQHTIPESEKPRGNRDCYKMGSIALVEGPEGITFALLAVSNFDKNNVARSSVDDLTQSINELINFYDCHGQGFDMCLPLVGTGLSKTRLSFAEALRHLISIFTINSRKVHGKIEIVVFEEDRDKVSIFDLYENVK